MLCGWRATILDRRGRHLVSDKRRLRKCGMSDISRLCWEAPSLPRGVPYRNVSGLIRPAPWFWGKMAGARREEYHGRKMARQIGCCIYCGASGKDTKLTDEHIVQYSLGADAYLK